MSSSMLRSASRNLINVAPPSARPPDSLTCRGSTLCPLIRTVVDDDDRFPAQERVLAEPMAARELRHNALDIGRFCCKPAQNGPRAIPGLGDDDMLAGVLRGDRSRDDRQVKRLAERRPHFWRRWLVGVSADGARQCTGSGPT